MALRVLIGMVLGVLGLAGLLAPAADGFTFTSAPGSPYPADGFPGSVAIGDFNGDGLPDIAVGTNATSPAMLPSRAARRGAGRAIVAITTPALASHPLEDP